MPQTVKPRGGAVKSIVCPYCRHPADVARRAMSIFCPQCKKRVILENYKITSYYAVREFYTCGDIVVEKKGHVVAPIKVGKLTVKGKVQGDVSASTTVELGKTAHVKGTIDAPSIKIVQGAHFDGFLRIGLSEPE